jgi:hypothetical protein
MVSADDFWDWGTCDVTTTGVAGTLMEMMVKVSKAVVFERQTFALLP